jgi:Tol biopolymer transport system component
VPFLGGSSRLVAADVYPNDGYFTLAFSPDNKRIAFKRLIRDTGDEHLVVANADGSGETVIFRRTAGMTGLWGGPSWSERNDRISVTTPEPSILVLTSEGKIANTIRLPFFSRAVSWLPDASGLFFVGQEKLTSSRWQIWFRPYPEGESFKITNDLNSYQSLSVTSDGKFLITVQRRPE